MTHPVHIEHAAPRLRRRIVAALACLLLLGQALAVAHALDAQSHVDERSCQLCQVANPAAGAVPAVAGAPAAAPAEPLAVPRRDLPGAALAPSLLPPSRAPPEHLTLP